MTESGSIPISQNRTLSNHTETSAVIVNPSIWRHIRTWVRLSDRIEEAKVVRKKVARVQCDVHTSV